MRKITTAEALAAQIQDGATIAISGNGGGMVEADHIMAAIEELPLTGSKPAAKVVINPRTGSIVMNQAVNLKPSAIAHGNLAITIDSTPVISQPNAFSQGETVVREKANIQVTQEPGSIVNVPSSANLADVVRSLNALGATPQDLLAILQALKAAGALEAELEVL